MKGISPWAMAASQALNDDNLPELFTYRYNNYIFSVYASDDAIWMIAGWTKGGKTAFRLAYAPGGGLKVDSSRKRERKLNIKASAVIGTFAIDLQFTEGEYPVARYTTTLTPAKDLFIPFWPRDIVIPAKDGDMTGIEGEVILKQVGTRSGQVFFTQTKPAGGTVLYLQNLTALANYNQQTQTSAGETVGGEWPELGFALPPAIQKPLKADKSIVITDAIVVFDAVVAKAEADVTKQYLNLLAQAYLQMPLPATRYRNWPKILHLGLHDLMESAGCWSQVAGRNYFNAYVSDYDTPPEIMVQLAVLLPLNDYVEWSGTSLDVIRKIKETLPTFYNKDLGTIMRWLPAAEDQLEGEEEQKKPMVMDSWYLHHPMLNLSRLALKGDKICTQLFLDSLDYAIKVAHHFKYRWPVFYNMETLEVLKAETQPGKGGEHDVPGLYAHIMLQAYELTGKKRYLDEAETAAKKLKGLGFDLFYQANNTAFGAGALLRLSKITGKQEYLDLSYLCLATIFKNVKLWDCNYGYGKNFPSFFALFPLNDAPYTAVYEEQEVFCAMHDYLRNANDVELLPSIKLLLAEYIRYLVDRGLYYYPPKLPAEMLADEPKIGEVDRKLYIALEDIHDGWEQSGQVGQEVYGAGNAFGILPRHYIRIADEDFMIYVDYPKANLRNPKGGPVSFRVLGDKRLPCRLVIVSSDSKKKIPEVEVVIDNDDKALTGKKIAGGHTGYAITGDVSVKVSWKH